MSLLTRLMGMVATPKSENGPKATEHGWATKYVVATRYKNPQMGYNVGFRFPLHPYDCDSAEMFDFIEKEGNGHIYQGGGYPGAEVFATFADVNDKESANRFLLGFLPKLNTFMARR
jgi:hypothetical protein